MIIFKKVMLYFLITTVACIGIFFSFCYYAHYSEGDRTGDLIKFSNKGYVFKTWEGEINQGLAGTSKFTFSVLDSDEKVIEDLKSSQGQYVKVTYIERYKTFPWWGDTKYFIIAVSKEKSPLVR